MSISATRYLTISKWPFKSSPNMLLLQRNILGRSLIDSNNSEIFRGNKLLSSLHPSAREFMFECGEIRPLQTGDVIFSEEEAMSHVVFPVEGVISFVTDVTGD